MELTTKEINDIVNREFKKELSELEQDKGILLEDTKERLYDEMVARTLQINKHLRWAISDLLLKKHRSIK